MYKHPNKNSIVEVFIYNHSPYNDQESSFDKKILNWAWDINDKRKVKRMKKYKKYYGNKKKPMNSNTRSGISTTTIQSKT